MPRQTAVNTDRYSFKYNQKDATLYNILYYCQCTTCQAASPQIISSTKLYSQHEAVKLDIHQLL
jgi:Na+-translocating ferredoxin:NAD+ oxidoreductase RnfC subunit